MSRKARSDARHAQEGTSPSQRRRPGRFSWDSMADAGVAATRAVRQRVRIRPPQQLPEPVDAGLQPERTSLAWSRTGLAAVVAGFMGVRWYDTMGALLLGVTALTILGGIGVAFTQRARFRRMASSFVERLPPPVGPVLWLTVMVTVTGLVAIFVVMVV